MAVWCCHLSQAREGAAPSLAEDRGASPRVVSQDGGGGFGGAVRWAKKRLEPSWPAVPAAAWESGAA